MKRVRILLMVAAAAVAAVPVAHAANPEQLFHRGYKQYKAGKYQEGLDSFLLAQTNMPPTPLFDPALLDYNIGVGHFRLSQPADAAESFRKSLKTTDIALQEKAYFNLGNSLYQTAQQKLDEGDVALAFRTFQDAQTNYVQAMRLNPEDRDMKVNYELTVLAQMRILQMVQMALSRLKQGDQLVGEYRFVEAAQWFQQNLPVVEKALAIEPDMKKQFQQMADRSGKVAGILSPGAPEPMPGATP